MEKYTIYCTSEQTRKALELGAPLYMQTVDDNEESIEVYENGRYDYFEIPTAEQMIGWLEEQEIIGCIDVVYEEDEYAFYLEADKVYELRKGRYNSRKEATLAAIDAALEYITNRQ